VIVWRVSNLADLSGIGGVKASGRWHNAGRPVAYCALHPATALLEKLVHQEVEASGLPAHYQYLKIEIPDGTAASEAPDPLPTGWELDEAVTRRVGDDWLASGATSLLLVPSVVMPETMNVLLNPLHPDAAGFRIVAAFPFPLDKRLLKTAVSASARR
jgi:RES domain-containing protein